jgi:CTP synthase (UTP-ammonia lyase)
MVISRMSAPRIALVGDHDPAVVAHQGIARSLELSTQSLPELEWEWVHTSSIGSKPGDRFSGFSGIWVIPASPYADTEAALGAIRLARERPVAFLGTCGGFQHAILEYARNVLHLHRAAHAELEPEAAIQVITPLSCSMVEQTGTVRVIPGSRLATIYGATVGAEGYHCSYGLNPDFEALLASGPLKVVARDDAGEVRAVELDGHPFYTATLFQPERAALKGPVHPLVTAFLHAAM